MEAFLVSTAAVAIAEIGDKTQLLTLVLTARYRKPWIILAGVLAATLANHALAATGGALLADFFEGPWFRWLVGLSFIVMAGFLLIPDKLEDTAKPGSDRFGPFLTTLVTFFLVEIGDKTQIATATLAAKYQAVFAVLMGSTLGLMLANAPAALAANFAAERLPLKAIRIGAAILFAVIGAYSLAA
jgi:putative Ca2+/H+ antiporter (TMEM165/GDT1 family)